MPTFTEVSGSEFFNNGSLSIRLRLCTSSAAYNQVHYFIQLQKSVLNLNTGSWYPVKDQSFYDSNRSLGGISRVCEQDRRRSAYSTRFAYLIKNLI